MSFEDIEVARAARAAKEIKGQGKRGRKRKRVAPDENELSQSQSQKWRVPWKRSSRAGGNVVGSVNLLLKRQMSQSQSQ
jgi:hypothetical protein